MAAKLRAQAPAAAAYLVVMCLLVLAATPASARPLEMLEKDGARAVESPVGDIQTVVGTVEHDVGAGGPGHKFMNIDMLGGIKDSGPSPGAGH